MNSEYISVASGERRTTQKPKAKWFKDILRANNGTLIYWIFCSDFSFPFFRYFYRWKRCLLFCMTVARSESMLISTHWHSKWLNAGASKTQRIFRFGKKSGAFLCFSLECISLMHSPEKYSICYLFIVYYGDGFLFFSSCLCSAYILTLFFE